MLNIRAERYIETIAARSRHLLESHLNIKNVQILHRRFEPPRHRFYDALHDAIAGGYIGREEQHDLDAADVVAAGHNEQDETVFAVAGIAETSRPINIRHVYRQNDTLKGAGFPTTQQVGIGNGLTDDDRSHAANQGVAVIIVPAAAADHD